MVVVEEVLLVLFVLVVVGGYIAPYAAGRRAFWRKDVKDPIVVARDRKEVAERKLQAIETEKEALRVEQQYEQVVDELYVDPKEKKRGD